MFSNWICIFLSKLVLFIVCEEIFWKALKRIWKPPNLMKFVLQFSRLILLKASWSSPSL